MLIVVFCAHFKFLLSELNSTIHQLYYNLLFFKRINVYLSKISNRIFSDISLYHGILVLAPANFVAAEHPYYI